MTTTIRKGASGMFPFSAAQMSDGDIAIIYSYFSGNPIPAVATPTPPPANTPTPPPATSIPTPDAEGYLPPSQPDASANVSAQCRAMNYAPRMFKLLSQTEYKNSVRDLFGADVTGLLPTDSTQNFFVNQSAVNMTDAMIDAYYAAAEKVVNDAKVQKFAFLSCSLSADLSSASIGNDACINKLLDDYATKIFRRPLTVTEKSNFKSLFSADLTSGNLGQGLGLAIQAMLLSPEFLYRSEVGDAVNGSSFAAGSFRLNQYEMASFLSYSFLATTPDAALLSAAQNNQLKTEAQVLQQVDRLLATTAAATHLGNFVVQWLGTGSAVFNAKDSSFGYSTEIAADLDREIRYTYASIVRNPTTDNTIFALFDADKIYINDRLASFYGLSSVGTDNFVAVSSNNQRGGLLTTGAFLASYSHASTTSPIARGAAIRSRVLCESQLPPPANAFDVTMELENTAPPGYAGWTTRQQYDYLTNTRDDCKVCHATKINPLGFGLEDFDAVGKYRTQENGKIIDSSGALNFVDVAGNPQSLSFNGAKQLGSILGNEDTVVSCFANNISYANIGINTQQPSAAEQLASQCINQELLANIQSNGGKLKALYQKLAILDAIRYRK